MAGFIEAAVEAVDCGDQAAGYRVQVATLASSQIHGRSQCIRCFFRLQACACEVQSSGSGILHAKGRICRCLFHGVVEQLRLFLGIAHRLVGELHGLIDLGKCIHTSSADCGERECDLC